MNWLRSLFRREPTRRYYTIVFYNPKETFTREDGGEILVCAPVHIERYLADSSETAFAMFKSDNPRCVHISISYWQ